MERGIKIKTKSPAQSQAKKISACFESGKPTITAKNPIAVKHLHHKPPHLAGLDGKAECVDNCGPPTVRMLVLAAPRRRCPQ
jgi:hypothetical protein